MWSGKVQSKHSRSRALRCRANLVRPEESLEENQAPVKAVPREVATVEPVLQRVLVDVVQHGHRHRPSVFLDLCQQRLKPATAGGPRFSRHRVSVGQRVSVGHLVSVKYLVSVGTLPKRDA